MLDRDGILGFLMIAPAVGYIAALVGFPFLMALTYSVSDATVGSASIQFAGLRNFRNILDNPTFIGALKNTFIFTFASMVLVIVLSKALALALVREFRGKWILRAVILLPWVAPISLGTIGWKWMLDSLYSVVNWMGRAVGLLGPDEWPMWLGDPTLAMISVILVHAWRMVPFATVVMLAGLSSIPKDIHDAALVDGAGFWRRLFEITLPMMLPIMMIAVLFGVVFTFTDMAVIYVLTRGGPFDTTQVLANLAFFTGVIGGDLAEGAAIALFLFPILVAVAVLLLKVAHRAEVA